MATASKFVSASFLLIFITFQIFSQTDESKFDRGLEVIKQSQKVINEKNLSYKITSLQIRFLNPLTKSYISNTEYFAEFPNKLRRLSWSNEKSKSFNIWNGEKFSSDYEMNINGKAYSQGAMVAKLSEEKKAEIEAKKKEKVKSMFSEDNLPDDPQTNFLGNYWYRLFPIVLDSSFEPEAKFEYIGKAEAGERRADIVDVKSQYFRKLRFFFDEKTHLLLMMIVRLENTDGFFEEKYYFSNYTVMDGILVAKTITNQNQDLDRDGKLIKKYAENYIYVEEFKLNPKFSDSLFKID